MCIQREIKRLKKKWGKDINLALYIFENKMTMYFAIHVSLLTTIYLTLGWSALKYQFVYTFWGVWYLEVINYIEHYGLQREKDENGIYESINKMHSWNSISNALLFRI